MAEDKFVELLWDNGQVVLHDQSGKSRRTATNFSSDVSRPYIHRANENDNKDVGASKSGRLEAADAFLNEFCLPDASYHVEPNAEDGDDDMVPWMNYPMEDSIPDDYYSEFLCDVPEANLHAMSAHMTSVPIHTNSAVSEFFRGSHSTEHGNTSKICLDVSDTIRTRISHFNELPQQGRASVFSGVKSKVEDFYTGVDNDGHKGLSGSFDGGKSQKQDLPTGKPLQLSTAGLMNFSHFTRPAALAMASLRNVGKLRSNENSSIPSIATSSKCLEPVVFQCGTKANLQSESQRELDPVPTKLYHEPSVKTSKNVPSFDHSKAKYQEHKTSNATRRNSDGENCISIDHNSGWGSNFTAGLPLTRSETEKGREALVASSSVCSGISAGAISNEPKQRDKRKVQEAEESSSHSDDFEDELVGQTKSATASKGPSTKRSRAAEVHNLSERRRRDRINEKMRALQELIPNCSKVDKASMLDEAIEYLKTLQTQVQMMSMGSGLCMPPMMLPGGMQHMGIPQIAHFPQIGLGMGMGMGMRLGYGMGMLDMNGSPNYTLLPVPPMHSPQYHCSAPSVPGVVGLQGVPASMAPMFRIPGQGLPLSATHAPPQTHAPGLPPPAIPSGAENNPVHALGTRPSSSSADQEEQIAKLEIVENCGTDGSQVPRC